MTRLRRDERRGRARKVLWAGAALSLAAGLLVTLRVGPEPAIRLDSDLPGIGKSTTVEVVFEEPVRGLGRLEVELIQGDTVHPLAAREHEPRPAWAFWGEATETDRLTVEVGSDTTKGLREGEATIRARAFPAPTWIRRPAATVAELTLPVRLRPPALQLLSTQHYPSQGGCEAVVYRVGDTATRDGVEVGDWWFPGFPLPGGGAGDRFALFAVPFDHTGTAEIRLVAEDEVLNRSDRAFVDRLLARDSKAARIELSDAFMETVVPEIMGQTPELEDRGDLLANYLQINGDLRAANAGELRSLGAASPGELKWAGAFMPMHNAQVMSAFADRRSYIYGGETVDRQDHLGFDLASTRMAEVPAGNRGTVVIARYFGIYGNAVVLDHGYGLMSLYGHLSSIDVAQGETVERGQTVGRSGETGLAAGDHLHFTMLLQGEPVNPVEWWDAGWIRDRLARKLGGALRFGV